MVQFIDFEVGVEVDIEEIDEVSDNSDLDSLSSFVDNEERENNVIFYRCFNNVEDDINETLKNKYEKGLQDIEISVKFLIYVKVERWNQELIILISQQKK